MSEQHNHATNVVIIRELLTRYPINPALSPSAFVRTYWSYYHQEYPSNNAINGAVFENLIIIALARAGIQNIYYQTEWATKFEQMEITEKGYVYDGLLAIKIANVLLSDTDYMQEGNYTDPPFSRYNYRFTIENISEEEEDISIWVIGTKLSYGIENDEILLPVGEQFTFKIRQKDGALLGIIDID